MASVMGQPANFRTPDRWNSVPVPPRVAERAYTRVDRDPNSGCWISRYSRASHGYSQVGWNGPDGRFVVLAHRASWVHVNGQVPLGVTLDHMCKTRTCVNPEHLRILPNYENARRTNGDDWEFGTCANGHPSRLLVPDPHRRTKAGRPRVGLRCAECKKLYAGRDNWRRRHGNEPYPEHLKLRIEGTPKPATAGFFVPGGRS